MLKFLSYITDIGEDKILELTPLSLRKAYSQVLETIGEAQASFYPIIEIDDQLYGYSSLSKMSSPTLTSCWWATKIG